MNGNSVVVPEMTYDEWKEWVGTGELPGRSSTKASGESHNKAPAGKPVQIATVDFSDKRSVMAQLRKAEKEAVGLSYEVNTSVTTDGKVWSVIGEDTSVDPSGIPSDLRGSYSYHNHPDSKTHYSFSPDDVAFFLNHGEEYTEASDSYYKYSMRRTEKTVVISADAVYNSFERIRKTDVRELAFNGEIDVDYDEFHETILRLTKELRIEYERQAKQGASGL